MSDSRLNTYIFGAGASSHARGPLEREFLKKGTGVLLMEAVKASAPPEKPHNRDEKNSSQCCITLDAFWKVLSFIDSLYRTTLVETLEKRIKEKLINLPHGIEHFLETISFEELRKYVRLALSAGAGEHDYRSLKKALDIFYLETLDFLTWSSLPPDIIKKNEDGTLSHRRNSYDRLIDYVIKPGEYNAFITFNTDLLLDRALFINNHSIMGDYNLSFNSTDNFTEYSARLASGFTKPPDVDLLKLHGSLNWLYCPTCKYTSLSSLKDYRARLYSSCPECSGELEPLIIPPLQPDEIMALPLGNVWRRAEEILSETDTLVVTGYSFPLTDPSARWLFKRALARNKKKPALYIVEPVLGTREKIAYFFANTVTLEKRNIESFEKLVRMVQEKES